MTNEEKLEYAKKNYIGKKVKSLYQEEHNDNAYIDIINEIEDVLEGGQLWGIGSNYGILLYEDDQWAEIISKPEESKMTHEKAIKEISKYEFVGAAEILPESLKAFRYAINQLKQCEVFDEPKEMVFSNSEGFHFYEEAKTLLTLNDQYLVEVGHNAFKFYNYAKPIKKEPLSFTDWYDKNYIKRGFSASIHYQQIEDYKTKHNQYLKDFKEDNK